MSKPSQHPCKPTRPTEVLLKFPDNRSHVAVSTFIVQKVATVRHGDIVPPAGTYDHEVKIGDVPVSVRADVFPTLTTAMVLGIDFVRVNAIAIDIPRGALVWNRPASRTTSVASTALPPVSCRSAKNPRIR